MNGPFQVAQASGTATSSTTGAPVRIYKLTKPLTDQAVMVNLGYDQQVKVDFSAIANEKITLVHVGDKLIILFDNESTVTVEPFFKSRADGLGGETRDEITVEMAPGRDISVKEFATLFPITTDTSVLPAADQGGNSNGNAQASGAYFSPFSVDPLDPVPLNKLAPQEELGNFVIEIPTGGNVLPDQGGNPIPDEEPPPNGFPSVAGIPLVQLDDENIPGGVGIPPRPRTWRSTSPTPRWPSPTAPSPCSSSSTTGMPAPARRPASPRSAPRRGRATRRTRPRRRRG